MIKLRPTVVSFLVSGRGSNFTVAAKKILAGEISARCGVVLSNKEDAPALEAARRLGIQAVYVGGSRERREEEMLRLLAACRTNLIVAAGYMSILSPKFIAAYKNRIINVHPSLLPSFAGLDAQTQALEYGVKIAGCTTHFIDEGTDTGPIIMQAAVAVAENDTRKSLAAKILKEEHRILPASIKLFCEGKLKIKGRRVVITK